MNRSFAVAAVVLAGLLGVPASAQAATKPPAPTTATTVKTVTTKPALRRTVVSRPVASVAGYGMAWVSVVVRHQTPTGLRASALSPVMVQRWTGTRWATVRTLTTDAAGRAVGVVDLPGGRQLVRVLRPVGATVTAATSVAVAVTVPAPSGEGCGCELAPPV